MLIKLPNVLAIDQLIAGNPIQQIGERGIQREGELVPFISNHVKGSVFRPADRNDEILIIPSARKQILPDDALRIVEAAFDSSESSVDLSNGLWLRHPELNLGNSTNREHEIEQTIQSWVNAFSYIQEDSNRNIKGLRGPQLGALHAVNAHWFVSNAPATIVMPTGTGKTDTMLSILVSMSCSKLFVVVPTDALRAQLANKFLTLGILKEPNCALLHPSTKYPLVCTLKHIPRDPEEVDAIFGHTQVIITTSSIAGQCGTAVQNQMASHCPYLFIDEAHHAEAPTWSAFKERFQKCRVLQFTATPFREDGRPLDGKIIFNYPLKKAQQEGYFKQIHFEPVIEFNLKKTDKTIAAKAVELLRMDSNKGHILMARVESIVRAKAVFALYEQYQEFNPVQIHTGIKKRQRDSIHRQIANGTSRIIVCVDMLGEGFDLPELKIAAFHDIRKTLAVTLQLVGRFTRVRADLGDATFIANIADVNVQDELRKLYTRDPDWNSLMPQLSDGVIGEQISLQEFLKGFTRFAEEIPLRMVRPATSTVVYRTACATWEPENFEAGIPSLKTCEQVHETTNHENHTLVIVTARREPLPWADIRSLFNWAWELYVVIWSPSQQLLYINSSTNSGEYKALAQAIAGESAMLIRGQNVFRAFAGVSYLRLQNVGLTEQLGRNVRYTGRMGSDIGPALSAVQRVTTQKSVLSGCGYEGGARITIGASRKGRIWSHRRSRIDQLSTWCIALGNKLLDDTIDPDEVLKGTLEARTILRRPTEMPISAEWPEEMYTALETLWRLEIGEREYTLNELDLELISPSMDGPLRFAIISDIDQVEVDLELFGTEESPDYGFIISGGKFVRAYRGGGARGTNVVDLFHDYPPVIRFANGATLEGNQYVELKVVYPPYDADGIQVWDWTDVNLRIESQGTEKLQNSIQARVIQELRKRDYDMIVDDDGKGEAADIVAIRLVGDKAAPSRIDVDFYHCKYSQESTPGHRIKDLYEVCGQAQKSISWMYSPEKRTDLFTHLLRREALRQETSSSSRYELGDSELLQTIREMSRLSPLFLKIYVVQPGLSRAQVTNDQLALMSVTENYLRETFQIDFSVIASQ